jgi:glycosyltransferase involved in cell wall biosynthesis
VRVLISAYACEPGAGSEPGTGWTWAKAAARDHDVWLLTRANNEPLLRAPLADFPSIRPVYIDLPSWASWWKRGQRGVHLYYLLWQLLTFFIARRLHRVHKFDVAHHVTLAIDSLPSAVAWIPGLPCVWGPVGGASPPAWFAWKWLGPRGSAQEAIREVISRPARRIFGDPTARRARIVVAQNSDVARRFRRSGLVVTEPNVAIDPATRAALRPAHRPQFYANRAIFAGRLIPSKGVELALTALALPDAADWELHIFGEGPGKPRLEKWVERHRLQDRVCFRGAVPREALFQEFAAAQAFLFPSLRDSAGWALAEAATAGMAVICINRGGPGEIAARSDGIAVSPTRLVANELAAALRAARETDSPTTAWLDDRIPGLLQQWYSLAVRSLDNTRSAST